MSTAEITVLVVVLLVIAIAAIVAVVVTKSRKRKHLQSRFGPEYDRTVESSGRRKDAERELAEREQRRQSLDIRPLPAADREQFAERWRSTQAEFVDHPELAVRQADVLVAEVMGRRGYPIGDFEQMSRDVSVDHAGVVDEYRAAHEISDLNDRKQATTEQLRQAMVHYRALFTDLLADSDDSDASSGAGEVRHTPAVGARDERGSDVPYADDGRGARVGSVADQDRDGLDDGAHDSHAHDSHAHDSGSHDSSGHDSGSPDHSAHDHDRKASDGIASDRIATSRSEGVRVEPGGLDRPRVEDRDRPRS